VKNVRRLLLILSAAFLAWAALVFATGGIEWHGVFRSRDPVRALAMGLGVFVLLAIAFPRAFLRDVERASAAMRRFAPVLVLGCALVLGAHAIRHGTFTAGGSDPFGYLSQAYGWAQGTMLRPQTFPISVPWPSADASLAPLGYSPGVQAHTMVPIYAPGLPLMMAAAMVVGDCGPFLVVPLCAALVVWLSFLLGRRMGGPWAGLLSAMFVATSPIVVFQALWPMSDVPSAAIWTGAALAALAGTRRGALAAGLWTTAGLLVRPNLFLLPIVLFAPVAFSSRERWTRMALFCAGAAPAVIVMATLYTFWHGAPWNTGFGSAGEIFLARNILPNLARYPVWLWQSQSPVVLLALVPLLPRFRRHVDRPATRLGAGLFLAALISYVVYNPFEEWWYLRYLLPAIPAVLALMSTGLVTLARRLPRPWGHVAVAGTALVLVAYTTRFNVRHEMFGVIKEDERRYAAVGAYIHDVLPANAIVFSVQESGSVRYYGGRMTIRWDNIDRDWTGRAAAEVERLGLHPYMVIEDWEQPQMRGWFGFAPEAPLPWPLVARLREPVGVNVLDMASRPDAAIVPAALVSGSAPLCSALQPLTIERR
jgi:dolichyl-phosphate-mannose-protein mannosyltransferase